MNDSADGVLDSFFVAGPPPTATAQQKGIGRRRDGTPYVYTKGRQRAALLDLSASIRNLARVRNLEGPITLFLSFHFTPPASLRPKLRPNEERPHDKRPDLDNLEKLVIDACTNAGLWHDDSQIAHKTAYKNWTGSDPGIFLMISRKPTKEREPTP